MLLESWPVQDGVQPGPLECVCSVLLRCRSLRVTLKMPCPPLSHLEVTQRPSSARLITSWAQRWRHPCPQIEPVGAGAHLPGWLRN